MSGEDRKRPSGEHKEKWSNSKGHWLVSNVWGVVAACSLLPYAALKTVWAFGGTIGLTSEQAIGQISGPSQALKETSAFLYALQSSGIDLTAVMATLASLFALCFVLPWRKKIPKLLLIVPGWLIGTGTVLLLGISMLQVAGLIPRGTTEGVQAWVFIITYGGFFVWGLFLFLATLSFQKQIGMRQDEAAPRES